MVTEKILQDPQVQIEHSTKMIGEKLFALMDHHSPSIFNIAYWSRFFMALTTRDPDLKKGLFKLVTVLPSLNRARDVVDHACQYLNPTLKRLGIPRLPGPRNPLKYIVSLGVKTGVRTVAGQFIAGADAESARKKLFKIRSNGYAFTVDMLGEYSVSEAECLHYLNRYLDAIKWLGTNKSRFKTPGRVSGHDADKTPLNISVKLSALYPGVHALNIQSAISVVSERLETIVQAAKKNQVDIYIDAEDTVTNQMVYPVFKTVFGKHRDMVPGIVVQGYAKGASGVIEDLLAFSKLRGNRIAIRLVKGAYWDSETGRAAEYRQPSPLFSHKTSSDFNYEALTSRLLESVDLCIPAFASHNIRSLAHAMACAESLRLSPQQFEFQMLYGMADEIAAAVSELGYLVRIYTPLGDAVSGMGYLVRRLIENTSNEGFLRHSVIDKDSAAALLDKPRNLG
jgi:proline dehydrogenase